MIILWAILALIVVGMCYIVGDLFSYNHEHDSISPSPVGNKRLPSQAFNRTLDDLSVPSWKILKENDALDSINKSDDLERVLKALDIKYNKHTVNSHLCATAYIAQRNPNYNTVLWTCKCMVPYSKDEVANLRGMDYHRAVAKNKKASSECLLFPEYRRLYIDVVSVRRAAAEQARAAQLSSVQHDLDEIEFVSQKYRDEAKIISQTTKELY